MTSPNFNNWASLYEAGFSIFPIKPRRKFPALVAWEPFQSARATEDQLAAWIEAHPGANIGIATGAISGCVVLDLDSAAALAEAQGRGLPPTVEARTPRGRHLYFAHPGHDVRNKAGIFAGADIRGDGGLVIAPGSYFVPDDEERADGKVEGGYAWETGRAPGDIAMAPLPAWLCEALSDAPERTMASVPPKALPASPQGSGTPYGRAALEREADAIRNAVKGSRNDTLNRAAFAVAQLVAGGELDTLNARAELEDAARHCGLTGHEIRVTLDSAFRAGSREPRNAPEAPVAFTSANIIGPAVNMTPATTALNLVSAADVTGRTFREREWLWRDWLPVGACTLLNGDGGTGKTLLAQMLATAVAAGAPLLGAETTRTNVLALYCEDDGDELARRQQAICTVMGIDPGHLTGSRYQSRFGQENLLGHFDKRTGAFVPNGLFDAIREEALASNVRLVILDNALHLFGDNINDPGAVTRFMAAMNRLALDINGAVLLLAHVAKAEGSRFAGTAAWSNASRNRLHMGRPEGLAGAQTPDTRVLTRDKANYARTGEELSFVWHRGAFARPQDLSPGAGALTDRDAIDNRTFLGLLDRFTAKQQALGVYANAPNHAPRKMAELQEHRHVPAFRDRMARAMGRLLTAGTIEADVEMLWRSPQRKPVFGLARSAPKLAPMLRLSSDERAANCAFSGGCQGVSSAPKLAPMLCADAAPKCAQAQVDGANIEGNEVRLSCADAAPKLPHTPVGYVGPDGGPPSPPPNTESRVDELLARLKAPGRRFG